MWNRLIRMGGGVSQLLFSMKYKVTLVIAPTQQASSCISPLSKITQHINGRGKEEGGGAKTPVISFVIRTAEIF